MRKKYRWTILVLILLVALPAGLSGCSSQGSAAADHEGLAMAPLHGMPASVKAAPVLVQESYQFAAANPEALQEIPCYCGCGNMGHTSNYDCYVQDINAQGEIQYDEHALGCSICVDITQDVMRLQVEGKDQAEIRVYIDDTYAQYGPTNIPVDQGP